MYQVFRKVICIQLSIVLVLVSVLGYFAIKPKHAEAFVPAAVIVGGSFIFTPEAVAGLGSFILSFAAAYGMKLAGPFIEDGIDTAIDNLGSDFLDWVNHGIDDLERWSNEVADLEEAYRQSAEQAGVGSIDPPDTPISDLPVESLADYLNELASQAQAGSISLSLLEPVAIDGSMNPMPFLFWLYLLTLLDNQRLEPIDSPSGSAKPFVYGNNFVDFYKANSDGSFDVSINFNGSNNAPSYWQLSDSSTFFDPFSTQQSDIFYCEKCDYGARYWYDVYPFARSRSSDYDQVIVIHKRYTCDCDHDLRPISLESFPFDPGISGLEYSWRWDFKCVHPIDDQYFFHTSSPPTDTVSIDSFISNLHEYFFSFYKLSFGLAGRWNFNNGLDYLCPALSSSLFDTTWNAISPLLPAPIQKYSDAVGSSFVSGGRLVGLDATHDGNIVTNPGTLKVFSSIPDSWDNALSQGQVLHVTNSFGNAVSSSAPAHAGSTSVSGSAVGSGVVSTTISDSISPSTAPPFSSVLCFCDLAEKITGKFPFCIPFDVFTVLSKFNASPEAPHFTWYFNTPVGMYELEVDLSPYDPVASILRLMFAIFLIIGLASLSARFYKDITSPS